MIERSPNGSCTPAAFNKAGSLIAMGVTRTAEIFMGASSIFLENLENTADYSHRLSDDPYFADLRKNCQAKMPCVE
jgi:hypothetical protein